MSVFSNQHKTINSSLSRNSLKLFLGFLLLFSITGISCSNNQVRSGGRKIVSSSKSEIPEWVMKKKSDTENYYFVGIQTHSSSLKNARRGAVDDAVGQLIEYIGFRATRTLESEKSMTDKGDETSFRQQITETIEGKGTAKISVNMTDFYTETYNDGTVDMYVLIQIPKKWVEKERQRIEDLNKQQRMKSASALKSAEQAIQDGNYGEAAGLLMQSMSQSRHSGENEDLFREANQMIISMYSSLSIRFKDPAKFIFYEGGSEPLTIQVTGKNREPANGILLEMKETGNQAKITAENGYLTSDQGTVVCFADAEDTISERLNQFDFTVRYSLKPIEKLKEIQPESYRQIQELQASQEFRFTLRAAPGDALYPTAVTIIKISTNQGNQPEISGKIQETVSAALANVGFKIISVDIPDSVFQNQDEKSIKNNLIQYIKKEYPKVERILFGYQINNFIGQIDNEIFSDYGVEMDEFQVAEIQFRLNLIDINQSEVIKGASYSVRGQGLNESQAWENAENKLTVKIEKEMKFGLTK